MRRKIYFTYERGIATRGNNRNHNRPIYLYKERYVVTIKEIAEQAGLSIGTVDRVLHKRGRVSKETEEKIKAIIKKTGYKTNIHARNLSLKATYIFGVIMPQPNQDGGYWEILRKGIDQAELELKSFNVHKRYFFFDKFSESSFVKAAEEALSECINGLIVAPVLFDACSGFVRSIPPDIPYVYVDSTIPQTKPLCTIGQDPFQSGFCAAKLMSMLIAGKGKIAVLRMLPNDFHINERVRGFLSFFKGNNNVKVNVFDIDCSADDNTFAGCLKEVDKKNGFYQGVFVTNAETHRAARVLKKKLNSPKKIIGYDCIEENIRMLEQGMIDFIISQNTREQGYLGFNTLFRYIVLKESCPPEVRMPVDIVISENMSYYR